MSRDDWAAIYRRLLTAYNKSPNAEQANIYFENLHKFTPGLVQMAVDRWVADARTWPHVSELRERIASIVASQTYQPPSCERCGGNYWIDADPRLFEGRTYTTARRCPDCRSSA